MECARRLHQKYTATDPELRRYRKNWIVIYILGTLTGICYFIAIPSLHQFVTSSSSPDDPSVRPGLGLNETWYSWVVSIASVGELVGAIAVGLLLRWCYCKHLILAILSVCCAGGVSFGIGKYGWMLLLGRFCMGLYQGGQMTILRTYLGETSTTVIAMLPAEKREKSMIKYTNFFLVFGVITIAIAVGPGLSSIAAEIPNLDQFRWSGYFVAIHSIVLAAVTLVFFRERQTDLKRGGRSSVNGRLSLPLYESFRNPRLELSIGGVLIGTIMYLLVAFFVISSSFIIVETMENPILSDHFGFRIQDISYVFLATTALFFIGNTIIYVLQKCHLDNRLICLLAYVFLLSGSVVATDWQAIGEDTCDQFSEENFQAVDKCDGSSGTSIIPLGEAEIVPVNGNISSPIRSNATVMDTYSVESCSECSSCMMEVKSICRRDFCCIVEEQFGVNTSKGIDCYWKQKSACVILKSGLTDGETLANITDNISCKDYSVSNVSRTEQAVLLSFNAKLNESGVASQQNYGHLAAEYGIDVSVCDGNTSASCVCEAFSGSPYHCFWNPNSRLTGEYCPRCEPLCRSQQHSIHFVQLIVGLSLLTPGFPMSRIILTVIVSDGIGTASQSLIMGSMVAVGAIARITGPLWGNFLYISAGRRTYLVMNVLTFLMLVVMILFLALYRTIKPRSIHPSSEHSNSDGDDLDDSEAPSVKAVRYLRESDQVELLTDMDCEDDDDGIDSGTEKI